VCAMSVWSSWMALASPVPGNAQLASYPMTVTFTVVWAVIFSVAASVPVTVTESLPRVSRVAAAGESAQPGMSMPLLLR
jgi:hypothetical protein